MLKPMVEIKNEAGTLIAEFWDCLRLDPAPVRDLRQHFENHLKNGGKPDLVVDLNGVTYAGSAALGGFIGIHRVSSQNSGRIVFCQVDENVLEVFRVSKLSPLFAFARDRAAALALLAAPPAPIPPPSSNSTMPRSGGPLRRSHRRDHET